MCDDIRVETHEGQGVRMGRDVQTPERLLALDVFRGLTIGAMVLVNNPGSWAAIWPQLAHADWHGWTLTDTVFPFFLVIVGLAIPMALGRRVASGGPELAVWLKIARRTALLFALGLWLNAFPFHNGLTGVWVTPGDIRIMGVLQRIALCYAACAAIFLLVRSARAQALIAVALAAVYGVAMALGGDLTPEGNLSGAIDRAVLTPAHVWKGSGGIYDPEGLFSTLPAISTTLAGVIAGRWLMTARPMAERVAGLAVWGFALLAAGWALDPVQPINKALWTPAYAAFMAGMGLLVLAACLWVVDVRGSRWWTWPFVVFGMNALALYVGSSMLARWMAWTPAGVGPDGAPVALKTVLFRSLFGGVEPAELGSFAFALAYLALWLAAMAVLWARRVFIRL